jgi:hypothetical protein
MLPANELNLCQLSLTKLSIRIHLYNLLWTKKIEADLVSVDQLWTAGLSDPSPNGKIEKCLKIPVWSKEWSIKFLRQMTVQRNPLNSIPNCTVGLNWIPIYYTKMWHRIPQSGQKELMINTGKFNFKIREQLWSTCVQCSDHRRSDSCDPCVNIKPLSKQIETSRLLNFSPLWSLWNSIGRLAVS